MSFEYEWTRDNLKEELVHKRNKTNLILLILGILIYTYIMYSGITSKLFDNLIIFIIGLIFIVLLILILFIGTKIFVAINLRRNDKATNKAYGKYLITLDDKSIIVQINDETITYNYKDISKLKKKKGEFFICTKKDKIGLIFKEKFLGKENYKQLLDKICQEIIC